MGGSTPCPSPDGQASNPSHQSSARQWRAWTSVKRAPRLRSRHVVRLLPPFPPTGEPVCFGKRSAPRGLRPETVPRAFPVLVPRPLRKHPPELAARSRRFGGGGSSSYDPNRTPQIQISKKSEIFSKIDNPSKATLRKPRPYGNPKISAKQQKACIRQKKRPHSCECGRE